MGTQTLRSFSLSYKAFHDPLRSKMAAQCLLSDGISGPLSGRRCSCDHSVRLSVICIASLGEEGRTPRGGALREIVSS